jgi:transketolase
MTILNPCDQHSARSAAHLAYKSTGPVYVRIDKGVQPDRYSDKTDFNQGAFQLRQGTDLLIIATGIMIHRAFDLSRHLEQHAIDAGIMDLFAIKPLNAPLIIQAIKKARTVITIEEHNLIGGIGSAISELMTDHHLQVPLKRYGIRDIYCTRYGDREWMHAYFGIDVPTMLAETVDWLHRLS